VGIKYKIFLDIIILRNFSLSNFDKTSKFHSFFNEKRIIFFKENVSNFDEISKKPVFSTGFLEIYCTIFISTTQ